MTNATDLSFNVKKTFLPQNNITSLMSQFMYVTDSTLPGQTAKVIAGLWCSEKHRPAAGSSLTGMQLGPGLRPVRPWWGGGQIKHKKGEGSCFCTNECMRAVGPVGQARAILLPCDCTEQTATESPDLGAPSADPLPPPPSIPPADKSARHRGCCTIRMDPWGRFSCGLVMHL